MSATRTRRRAQLRHLRREIKADGCTCNPAIRPIHDELVTAVEELLGRRSRGAFDAHHADWCPVSIAIQKLIDNGIMPVRVFNSGTECQR
jgi:hypothetical protein